MSKLYFVFLRPLVNSHKKISESSLCFSSVDDNEDDVNEMDRLKVCTYSNTLVFMLFSRKAAVGLEDRRGK